jgi:hypothetical protein
MSRVFGHTGADAYDQQGRIRLINPLRHDVPGSSDDSRNHQRSDQDPASQPNRSQEANDQVKRGCRSILSFLNAEQMSVWN